MRRGLLAVLLIVLLMLASGAAQAAPTATCTPQQKAARVAAANRYAKKIPAERRAYFKRHHGPAQRKRFVAAQKRKLARLRAAAACTVPAADFSLEATPSLIGVQAGSSATATIRIVPENGFSEALSFTASKVGGVTFSFAPAASGTATLTVTAALNAAVGTATTTITGTGGGKAHTLTMAIDVSAVSTLTILPDVPTDRANAARVGYETGLSYLPKLGAPAYWHADVFVAGDVDEIVAEFQKDTGSSGDFIYQVMADGGGGFAGPEHVYTVPAGTSYDSMLYERRVQIIVHEMWHTVQYALADGRQDPSPTWLHEGSAEFVGYSGVQDAGIDASSIRRDTIWAVTHDFADIPLESSTGSAAYNEGFAAVERLAAQHGMASLVTYWTEVGSGVAWETAFHDVFGETVQQFYIDFAAYRQTLS